MFELVFFFYVEWKKFIKNKQKIFGLFLKIKKIKRRKIFFIN